MISAALIQAYMHVPVNKWLNAFLNIRRFDRESQLLKQFIDKHIVT